MLAVVVNGQRNKLLSSSSPREKLICDISAVLYCSSCRNGTCLGEGHGAGAVTQHLGIEQSIGCADGR